MLFDQAIDIPKELTSDAVTVSLLDERIRYSLRVKPTDVTAFKKTTGLNLPKKIGQSTGTKGILSLCLGPDEWLIIAPKSIEETLSEKLVQASNDFTCSVTDVSHRNIGFEISGTSAAALINVGCPQDLSLEKFPVGKTSRTVFESATVVLVRSSETSFHLEAWRSFGPYLRDFFKRVLTT